MNTLTDNHIAASLTDEEIARRIIAGEKNLYERIIRKYNPRLYRIGMTIIKNDGEIEDIMQNVYIKAYERLHTFEFKSAFGTWLTKILINECLQFLKKRKNAGLNKAYMHSATTEHTTPDSVTMNKELAKALETALQELPEKYRLVFVMREIEDMSTAETVDALELSESNVKVRLNRAKLMLRDKLNQYYKSDEVFHFHLSRSNRIVEKVHKALGI